MKVQRLMVISHTVADYTASAADTEAHTDDELVLRMLVDTAPHVVVVVDGMLAAAADN